MNRLYRSEIRWMAQDRLDLLPEIDENAPSLGIGGRASATGQMVPARLINFALQSSVISNLPLVSEGLTEAGVDLWSVSSKLLRSGVCLVTKLALKQLIFRRIVNLWILFDDAPLFIYFSRNFNCTFLWPQFLSNYSTLFTFLILHPRPNLFFIYLPINDWVI